VVLNDGTRNGVPVVSPTIQCCMHSTAARVPLSVSDNRDQEGLRRSGDQHPAGVLLVGGLNLADPAASCPGGEQSDRFGRSQPRVRRRGNRQRRFEECGRGYQTRPREETAGVSPFEATGAIHRHRRPRSQRRAAGRPASTGKTLAGQGDLLARRGALLLDGGSSFVEMVSWVWAPARWCAICSSAAKEKAPWHHFIE